ncbi:uncharacterized protein BP5553_10546 [Venustampulla echinocandica]|uniref:Ubiquitin 3 binding protein But2 C-terminal domain-containing protein n=1 Tax=Venustampulla echinocandica TaxID=2656787 RepID=A0A370T8W0_9HELO|nr:uncharacterized protein BP5553_10546 [Venustampulla echinocandica]RDL29919.1 hypothetical protein BP5553_10546 [Venustampulla echinocandica]
MRFSTISLSFLSLINLSSAAATPVELAPPCGTTLYPTILQQIYEDRPFKVFANNRNFYVSQEFDASGNVYNRTYQIVGFEKIPPGSYACQLNVKFSAGYNIAASGTPTLNVKTLFNGDSNKIKSPNHWTWNKFYRGTSSPFGQGIFGTTTLTPGISSAINRCPTGGGNLAFMFEIADRVLTDANVQFKQTDKGGLYLTYNC